MIRRLLAALALAAAAAPAMAQGADIDYDALFGSEDDLFVEVSEDEAAVPGQALIQTQSVRVGGSVSGSATASWTWNDPYQDFSINGFDSYGLKPALSATLFFDARPSADSRFYGSVKTAWPFETNRTFLTGAEYVDDLDGPFLPGTDPGVIKTSSSIKELNISVFELFADFNYDESVFFRFGKQTVNWGVGYFFSPANVINLESIDPFDPERQLEGPVSLRAHYPIPRTQHNLWAYAVLPAADMKPEDVQLAAKAEFVSGAWEFGIGGWYAYERPLRGIVTASGSVGQVSLFGEGYVARGSDRTWVETIPFDIQTGAGTRSDDSSIFIKGSAGFLWSKSDWNFSVAGQYLYDSEGYDDDDRKGLIEDAKVLLAGPGGDALTPLYKLLVLNSGRHYAALNLSKSELGLKDLSANLTVLANLSDWSGIARPSLSFRLFKGMSASLSASFAFGLEDSEYLVLNDGPAMSWSFGLTMGSGGF